MVESKTSDKCALIIRTHGSYGCCCEVLAFGINIVYIFLLCVYRW